MLSFNHLLSMWRSSFSPLRSQPFRLYLGGQAISFVGTYLQATAQSLLVYQLSNGSATALGIVALLTALPSLLFSIWIGKIIDRFDRRKLILAIQIGQMMLAFVLGILVQTEQVQLWHVYALAFALGALNAFVMPAQIAFEMDIVGAAQLRDAINLGAMIHNASRAIGPALAGFAISTYGLSITFWLNGLSFLTVIASLLMIHVPQQQLEETGRTNSATFTDGLRFIQRSPRVRDVLISFALLALCGQAVYAIVPALVRGSATQTGSLLGAAGAGSLFAVLLVMPFVNRTRHIGLALSIGVIWMGVWLILLAQSNIIALSLVSIFMAGIATTVVWDGSLGLLQVIPPEAMRVQMLNFHNIVGAGLLPLASLILSYLADRISPSLAVLLSGLTMTLLAGLMLTRISWRGWEIQPSASQPENSLLEIQATPESK